MKRKYWICAYFKEGKFSHYLMETTSLTKAQSTFEMTNIFDHSKTWKDWKKEGFKCIEVIIQPIEK